MNGAQKVCCVLTIAVTVGVFRVPIVDATLEWYVRSALRYVVIEPVFPRCSLLRYWEPQRLSAYAEGCYFVSVCATVCEPLAVE